MLKRMKKKHALKSKEDLIADLQKNQKWVEKMDFAKNKFYPALIDLDTNVDDTKIFLASINTILMEKVIGGMKEMKFKEMKLVDSLDPKDEKFEGYKKLLELFDDKSAFDAKDLIEGMRSEISTFENDLMKETKLADLKTQWLDE